MHHGCFFHFCQSLYKQIQQLGLSTGYLDDDEVRLACRSSMALALLPVDLVDQAYEKLKEVSPQEMSEFFSYFKRQWLKRVSPTYWNVSNLQFRTNNYTEGSNISVLKIYSIFPQ